MTSETIQIIPAPPKRGDLVLCDDGYLGIVSSQEGTTLDVFIGNGLMRCLSMDKIKVVSFKVGCAAAANFDEMMRVEFRRGDDA